MSAESVVIMTINEYLFNQAGHRSSISESTLFYDARTRIPFVRAKIQTKLEIGQIYVFEHVDEDDRAFYLVVRSEGDVYIMVEHSFSYQTPWECEESQLDGNYVKCDALAEFGIDLSSVKSR